MHALDFHATAPPDSQASRPSRCRQPSTRASRRRTRGTSASGATSGLQSPPWLRRLCPPAGRLGATSPPAYSLRRLSSLRPSHSSSGRSRRRQGRGSPSCWRSAAAARGQTSRCACRGCGRWRRSSRSQSCPRGSPTLSSCCCCRSCGRHCHRRRCRHHQGMLQTSAPPLRRVAPLLLLPRASCLCMPVPPLAPAFLHRSRSRKPLPVPLALPRHLSGGGRQPASPRTSPSRTSSTRGILSHCTGTPRAAPGLWET